jgi:hypothetical protein
VHLSADVMSHQSNNAFAVWSGQSFAGFRQASRQSIDPQSTIEIEHHLDDGRIFEKPCNRRTEGCAQHACATRDRLRLK